MWSCQMMIYLTKTNFWGYEAHVFHRFCDQGLHTFQNRASRFQKRTKNSRRKYIIKRYYCFADTFRKTDFSTCTYYNHLCKSPPLVLSQVTYMFMHVLTCISTCWKYAHACARSISEFLCRQIRILNKEIHLLDSRSRLTIPWNLHLGPHHPLQWLWESL